MYSIPGDRASKSGDEQCSTTAMSNVAQDDVYYSTARDLSSKLHVVTNATKRAKFDQGENDYLVPVDTLPKEADYSNLIMATTYVELPVGRNCSITEHETSEAARNQDLTTTETNRRVRSVRSDYTPEWEGHSEATDSPISLICGTHASIKPVKNHKSN